MNYNTRAFITGITGQLGSYLAKFLLDKGIEVYGLVRRSSCNGNLVRLQELDILDKITIINGDITDIGTLIDGIRISEPDYVFNLAAHCLSGNTLIKFLDKTTGKQDPKKYKTLEELCTVWNYGFREKFKGSEKERQWARESISKWSIEMFDPNTGARTIGNISDVLYTGIKKVYRYSIDRRKDNIAFIECTDNHRVYGENIGWITIDKAFKDKIRIARFHQGKPDYITEEIPKYSDEEIWKDTKFIGYQVSSHGNVRKVKSPDSKEYKLVKQYISKRGYYCVSIVKYGFTQKNVHQMVADAFMLDRPNEFSEIRHLDSNSLNNHISNLKYGTSKENKEDGIKRYGRTFTTERNLHFVSLVSKEYLGEQKTYDLEINHELHNYLIGNGLVVHNSHVGDSFAAPKLVAEVDYIGTINLLEALRITGFERFVKLAHMSTSELFGDTKPPQSETSIFNPQSPYACAKLAAYHLIKNYREANKLFYCNAITFNFESPLRNEDFVTKKICKQMAEIKLGKRDKIFLGNLKAKRDWQSVHDVIDGLWLMLNHSKADDFVFASEQAKTVYDLYQYVCKKLELDPLKYLYSDETLLRPNEVDYLLGDASKAKKLLKWKPKYDFEKLIGEMVEYEVDKLRG